MDLGNSETLRPDFQGTVRIRCRRGSAIHQRSRQIPTWHRQASRSICCLRISLSQATRTFRAIGAGELTYTRTRPSRSHACGSGQSGFGPLENNMTSPRSRKSTVRPRRLQPSIAGFDQDSAGPDMILTATSTRHRRESRTDGPPLRAIIRPHRRVGQSMTDMSYNVLAMVMG